MWSGVLVDDEDDFRFSALQVREAEQDLRAIWRSARLRCKHLVFELAHASGQIATPGQPVLVLAADRLASRRLVAVLRRRELTAQLIERRQLGRKLELELRGVHALSLGDHEVPACS